ncbi:flagellar hook assembly protein FlgD [Pseudomarimonas arenosa]|uniref:Basal-body rod modification protein FlgD n=1 Tax=Pseudomarimonas arenosa TaxID=2774145 RepID=A0AAW3ZFB1_9GAMM|nr:flagellar hook assembly protein FlgD [Pseudomarimonas arenosa]MBD8524761.1 flagellar hook assembly protein FlgD [Pseudomarimonas arenosa]
MQIVPTAASFKSVSDPRKSEDLGQADFLRLMMEQLKNQDPLKPLDSNQFLGQLAQFSTVQGIQGLNASFQNFVDASMDDQALQAASLIGRDALVSSSTFQLDEGGGMSGLLDVPQTGQVSIEITDASGAIVRRMSFEANAGARDFAWDGVTDAGEQAPPGVYRINARVGSGSSAIAVESMVNARIESVSFSRSGLILNLAGGGSIPFYAVRRIG